ncbi:MAG: signal peptide peptidase SppA [Akkermansiaceae bacterium]|nr:signal peptide peptidase SppA [Akkermansiaceae bacterium]
MKSLPFFASAALTCLAQAAPTVAVYDLGPGISESGMADSMSLFSPQIDASRPLTFHDISTSLAKAAKDPELRAVVVDADDAGLGLPQILEVRRHLLALRKAGKDVWVYSDHFNPKSALLGSAANHFMLMPEADSDFAGLSSESMYFKGLLDKVGVQADVIHIGDFKSFGEEFYRTGPSEFAEKQQTELIDRIFQVLHRSVAEGRGVDEAEVLRLINQGTFTAAEAEEAGLVDGLAYRTDFNRRVRETYAEAEFDDNYQLPDRDGPEIKGLLDLVKLFMNAGTDPQADSEYVAVVVLEGGISDETVAPVREAILKLLKDEKAKALVLRVDSPGGSALASEVLWEVTDEWKASGRPFAVSMGGVAASGGYYVSAAADRIFAEEGTVTGSIGVVGMKLVTAGAMEKLGITTHRIERGEHADAMSMTKPFTPEESELVRKSMLAVYGTFKKRIIDGRGDRLKGELEGMAGGRVYTGVKALELGLVDELGGLAEAIAWAGERAGLAEPISRLRPEPKSMLEGLFATPEKSDDDELVKIQVAPHSATEAIRGAFREAGISALPESARESVSRALQRLDGISESRIQLIGPDFKLEW